MSENAGDKININARTTTKLHAENAKSRGSARKNRRFAREALANLRILLACPVRPPQGRGRTGTQQIRAIVLKNKLTDANRNLRF